MKRPDVILSIVGGLLVLAVSVTLGVQAVTGFFTPYSYGPYTTPTYDEGPDGDFSPLATGEPGSPVALAPDVPDGVFHRGHFSDVGATLAHYLALQMSPMGTAGIEQSSHRGGEHSVFAGLWDGDGNFADECFFTSPTSPVVEPLGAAGVREDPIAHIGGGSAMNASLEQWARIFPDTASAAEYMATLDAGLEVAPATRTRTATRPTSSFARPRSTCPTVSLPSGGCAMTSPRRSLLRDGPPASEPGDPHGRLQRRHVHRRADAGVHGGSGDRAGRVPLP